MVYLIHSLPVSHNFFGIVNTTIHNLRIIYTPLWFFFPIFFLSSFFDSFYFRISQKNSLVRKNIIILWYSMNVVVFYFFHDILIFTPRFLYLVEQTPNTWNIILFYRKSWKSILLFTHYRSMIRHVHIFMTEALLSDKTKYTIKQLHILHDGLF